MPNQSNRIEALRLLERAIELRQTEAGANPSEVERCLAEAVGLDPDSTEILGEAARFHNSLGNSAKARNYAAACGEQAQRIAVEMKTILGESFLQKNATPASRHIGGIIGPY